MGGAPLLLALAAITVDYGWQPDDKGGIEYIIQIPPGQLEQSGGFTSRIDPRVRGLVSRVVVRVGDGPLPQDFGDLAPNSAPDELGPVLGAIQQVTETQVWEASDPSTVVRGQNGVPNGGFTLPGQMGTAPQTAQQPRTTTNQAAPNSVRNVGNAMPSTSAFTADTTNRNTGTTNNANPALQNFRSGTNDPSQQNAAAAPTNDLRSYNDPRASQAAATGSSTYRDSSWQSNANQPRATAPSTAPYGPTREEMTTATNQQPNLYNTNTNNAAQGAPANNNTYDRNNPNANPAYATDNRNGSPLSTFANPNPNTTTNETNGYSAPGYANQYGNNQYTQQQPQPNDTNLQTVNSNQPGYNSQQAPQNGYANNQNLGPLRNGYGTGTNGNQGQYPNGNYSGDGTGFVNNGNPNNLNAQSANPGLGYPNPNYNSGLGYPQSQLGLGSAAYAQGAYGQQTDPRLLIAANGGLFNGSIRDQLGKTESDDKTSALLLAERERLSTKTLELERENDTLAKAKDALLYDNNTLIAESRVTKDRLQSMSVFQFFLMISFLANLYLGVHLSKLYQRYRDLVTTVRASTASAQPS
ncbi:hypothetical protein Poly24_14920 [Rosistilla carotiformis]|uniref:Uncharacterized protein n=1 Tax=Rosistilla carotiformis TaxID=2528017 RepID=A0A518JQJ0_9BACT|nr:hypothetical protein [Rosistilla carotiformis]QDV67788.1 hypothetical protein Poly24_14920 [Rosistilla carotiformis]